MFLQELNLVNLVFLVVDVHQKVFKIMRLFLLLLLRLLIRVLRMRVRLKAMSPHTLSLAPSRSPLTPRLLLLLLFLPLLSFRLPRTVLIFFHAVGPFRSGGCFVSGLFWGEHDTFVFVVFADSLFYLGFGDSIY